MPKVKSEHRTATSAFNDVRGLEAYAADKHNCSVVAVAFACGVTYEVAQLAMAEAGREKDSSATDEMIEKAIKSLGGKLKDVDMREIIDTFPAPHDMLKNLTLHHPVRFKDEWPEGTYLAFSKRHVSAIVEGEVHDWARGTTKRLRRLVQVTMPAAAEESPQSSDEDEHAVDQAA